MARGAVRSAYDLAEAFAYLCRAPDGADRSVRGVVAHLVARGSSKVAERGAAYAESVARAALARPR